MKTPLLYNLLLRLVSLLIASSIMVSLLIIPQGIIAQSIVEDWTLSDGGTSKVIKDDKIYISGSSGTSCIDIASGNIDWQNPNAIGSLECHNDNIYVQSSNTVTILNTSSGALLQSIMFHDKPGSYRLIYDGNRIYWSVVTSDPNFIISTDGSAHSGSNDIVAGCYNTTTLSSEFLIWIGGSSNEVLHSMELLNGQLYLSGVTFSLDLPVTNGSLPPQFLQSGTGGLLGSVNTTSGMIESLSYYAEPAVGFPFGITNSTIIGYNSQLYLYRESRPSFISSLFQVLSQINLVTLELDQTSSITDFPFSVQNQIANLEIDDDKLLISSNYNDATYIDSFGNSHSNVSGGPRYGSVIICYNLEDEEIEWSRYYAEQFDNSEIAISNDKVYYTSNLEPEFWDITDGTLGNETYLSILDGATGDIINSQHIGSYDSESDICVQDVDGCPRIILVEPSQQVSSLFLDLRFDAPNTISPNAYEGFCLGSPIPAFDGSSIEPESCVLPTYKWEQSVSSSGPWTQVPGAVLEDYTPPVLANDRYYHRVVCNPCSGQTVSTSNVVLVEGSALVAPSADAGEIVYTCPNTTVQIGGSLTGSGGVGPLTYEWSLPGFLDDATIANPEATVSESTVFSVTVTDGNGCFDIAQTIVNVLQIDAGEDRVICPSGGVDEVIIGDAPIPGSPITYQWTPTTGLSCPTCASTIANPAVTTVYTLTATVTLTDGNTCAVDDVVEVEVVEEPPLLDDIIVCKSEAIQIGTPALDGFSYFWSSSNASVNATLSSIIESNPTFQGGNTTNIPLVYTLVLTKGGCIWVREQRIIVIEDRFSYCHTAGGTIGIEQTYLTDNGATYQWSVVSGPNNINGQLDGAVITVNPSNSQSVYEREVCLMGVCCITTVESGCEDGVDNLCNVPFVYELGGPLMACPGEIIDIGIDDTEGFLYSWSNVTDGRNYWIDSAQPVLDNPQIIVPNLTSSCGTNSTLEYELIVINGACADTVRRQIDIFSINAIAGEDIIACPNSTITLGHPDNCPNYTYSWSPVSTWLNGTSENSPNPQVQVSIDNTYTVTITDNITGCVITDDVFIDVESNPELNIEDQYSLCTTGQQEISVEVSNAASYSWTPNKYLSCIDCPNPVISNPLMDITYTLVVGFEGGCLSQPFEIDVIVEDEIIDLDDAIKCDGINSRINPDSLGECDNCTYSWTPTTGLDNPTVINPSTSTNVDITYLFEVTQPDGCIATGDISVIQNSTTLSLEEVNKCPSGEVRINPNLVGECVGCTYTWQPSSNLNSASVINPVSTTPTDQIYTLEVSQPDGCIITGELSVLTNLTPSSFSLDDIEACQGDEVPINPLMNGSCSGCSYSWAPNVGLDNNNVINPNLTISSDRTYTLEVTEANGCISSQSLVVTSDSDFVNAGSNTKICKDDVYQLGTSINPVNTQWTPSAGLTGNPGPQPVFTATVAGTFSFIAQGTNSDGCVVSDEVTITVIDPPVPDMSDAEAICQGSCVFIGEPRESGYSYFWSPILGLDDPSSSMTLACPSTTTEYTVTKVHNGSGCFVQAQVIVQVEDTAPPTVSLSDQMACIGDNVMTNFSISPVGGDYTIEWSPLIGLTSPFTIDPGLDISLLSAGVHTYQLTVFDNVTGCSVIDQFEIDLTDDSLLEINAGTYIIDCEQPTLNLNSIVSDPAIVQSYSWITQGDGSFSSTNTAQSTYSFGQNDLLANSVDLIIEVMSTCGNTFQATTTVEWDESAIIEFDQVSEVCEGDDITIVPDITSDATIISFSWTGPNSFMNAFNQITISNFTSANQGTYTLEIEDENGCISSQQFTLDFTDNDPPVCLLQNIIVQLDSDGNTPSITFGEIDAGSSDNCGFTVEDFSAQFDCTNIGDNNLDIILTDSVNDVLSTNCSTTITVEDNVPPMCVTQNISVSLIGGVYDLLASEVDLGSSDNCEVSLSVLPFTFNCTNLGDNVVTLTVSDPSGNTSSCDATVTINEQSAPTCLLQDITLQIDGNANVPSLVFADVDNGSSNNCGFTSSITPTVFDCSDIGNNVVNVILTDINNQQLVTNCTTTVTIEDNVSPFCLPKDITVSLSGGIYALTAAELDGGSTDNCSVDLSIPSTTFDCMDMGSPVIVTLSATDPSGNTSSCTADVTVMSEAAPVCMTQSITINLDANGQANYVAEDIDNGSSAECGGVTLYATPTTFDCSQIGANTVMLTVTDDSGRSSTCMAMVTVLDDVDPTCVPIDITVSLDHDGLSTITVSDIDDGSTDNCSVQTVSISQNQFTCSDSGIVPVTLTVTDASGNITECTGNVTVQDTLAPICPTGVDLNMQLKPGQCDTVLTVEIPMPIDNCDPNPTTTIITQLGTGSANTNTGTFAIGTHTIDYQVSDSYGNIDTCSFNIEVLEHVPEAMPCFSDINLSLDPLTCEAVLTPEMLLLSLDDIGCVDSCTITVKDAHGNVLPDLITGDAIGKNYTYEICCGGYCCWGNILIESKGFPLLNCGETQQVFACSVENADLTSLLLPTAPSACTQFNFKLISEDLVTNDSCSTDSLLLATLTRCYVAEDDSGNTSEECCQIIEIMRIDLGEINFPEDVTLAGCTDSIDIGMTGLPTICSGGKIEFVDSGQDLDCNVSDGVVLGDFDGDGFLDAFPSALAQGICNNGNDVFAWFNDGSGLLTIPVNLGPISGATVVTNETVDFGDFDGDGNLDLVELRAGSLRIWFNEGSRIFSLSNNSTTNSGTTSIASGDINGDGIDDIYISNSSSTDQIWFGNPSRNLNSGIQFLNIGVTNAAELADFDNDGYLDVVTTSGSGIEIRLNNGLGTIIDSPVLVGGLSSSARNIDIEDIDNNGYLDIATTTSNFWFNDGSLNFSAGQFLGNFIDIELEDIDTDGDLDAITLRANGVEIWSNVGSGQFSSVSYLVTAESGIAGIDIGDFNNDSMPDIYAALIRSSTQGGVDKIFFNESTSTICYDLDLENIPTDLCNLNITYSDTPISSTDCGEKIMRLWTATEWFCHQEIQVSQPQFITIRDTIVPEISCGTNLSLTTGYDCTASLTIPQVTATDNCSEVGHISARISCDSTFIERTIYNILEDDSSVDLPIGDYTLTYIAHDACDNTAECSIEVTVVDDTPPVTICDNEIVVSVGGAEKVYIYADIIGADSFDECQLDSVQIRRMEVQCDTIAATVWRDKVAFCCADAGQSHLVAIQSIDKSGNTNICMSTITVQNKVLPLLICPQDTTVDCTDPIDLDSLALSFPNATAQHECSTTDSIVESHVADFNDCGLGRILRTFTIMNDIDTIDISCTQTITIENRDTFDFSTIDWPDETIEIYDACDQSVFDPALLDARDSFQVYPEFEDGFCHLLGYSYEDDAFATATGDDACYKVLRTWKVIDWCQSQNATFVVDSFIQTLKLYNTVAPTLEACMDAVYRSSDPACDELAIDLFAPGASDDCTDSLSYDYQIVLASGETISGTGQDASGTYPYGIHQVTWRVTDSCGNVSSCTQQITILSEALPKPTCHGGLIAVLLPVDTDNDGTVDGGEVELWVSDFDIYHEHPCGFPIELSFDSLALEPNMTFDCSHLGSNAVPIYYTVIDSLGNAILNGDGRRLQSSCIASLNIQDGGNANLCPDNLVAGNRNIRGRIITEDDEGIQSTSVALIGDDTEEYITDEHGQYAFPEMSMGNQYTIKPEKKDNPINGVSTMDLILMQKHILGIVDLDSPYKMIAADVNSSGSISGVDLIEMRKLILAHNLEFPSTPSWKMVDASYEFLDPKNPFAENYPTDYKIQELNENMEINFVGVKMGDVSMSADPNSLIKAEIRTSPEVLTLDVSPHITATELRYDFRADDFIDIEGFQFTLDIESESLSFDRVEDGLLDLTNDHIGLRHLDSGHMTVSYDKVGGVTAGDDELLFSLVFNHSEVRDYTLSISSQLISAEAYSTRDVFGIDAQLVSADDQITLHQNRPNPWSESTLITFSLPQSMNYEVRFYDVDGDLLLRRSDHGHSGINELLLSQEELNVNGLIYYELITPSDKSYKKMILVR